jgi:hypothetical protein
MHRAIICDDAWVMDGTWDHLGMDERLRRATAVIWLDLPFLTCLWNFYARLLWSFLRPAPYLGQLEGSRAHRLSAYPFTNRSIYARKRPYYLEIGQNFPHLTVVCLRSFSQLGDFFRRVADGAAAVPVLPAAL